MVEGTCLESRRPLTGPEGSNPSLSSNRLLWCDCSSVVEPRIVIPVVAGSRPASHPKEAFAVLLGRVASRASLTQLDSVVVL